MEICFDWWEFACFDWWKFVCFDWWTFACFVWWKFVLIGGYLLVLIGRHVLVLICLQKRNHASTCMQKKHSSYISFIFSHDLSLLSLDVNNF